MFPIPNEVSLCKICGIFYTSNKPDDHCACGCREFQKYKKDDLDEKIQLINVLFNNHFSTLFISAALKQTEILQILGAIRFLKIREGKDWNLADIDEIKPILEEIKQIIINKENK